MGYLFQYAPAPAGKEPWPYTSSSQSFITLSGLEPLMQYSFKVTILGRRGQTISTGIITKMVI